MHAPPAARLAFVLLLAALALGPVAWGPPAAEAGGPPGQELLQIPVRWCAVQGSDAQANPGSVGEPTTNDYLWRRHERASDRVWIPGAGITFRSAFAAAVVAQASFPVIPDPLPPAAGGPGQVGDILDPSVNDQELMDAFASCDQAWNALSLQLGKSLVGFAAVNLHRFVDANGEPAFLQGRGYSSYTGSGNPCANPPTGTFAWSGRVAIADYSLIRGFDPDDLTLAHEFGHTLGLGHGNGQDDNNNGVYDDHSSTMCDPAENEDATPFTVMSNGNNKNRTLTALQRQTSRALALKYAGAQKDPPAALLDADTVSDQRTDTIREVNDPGVDLASAAVAGNAGEGVTVFAHGLAGLVPKEDVENQYLVFADLDDDPATGGPPADLGFRTDFQGAELVTRVVVGPGHDARPTVWVFDGGGFTEVNRDFRVAVTTQSDPETGEAISDSVSIEIPNDVAQPLATPIQIQAVAEQLAGDGELDRLPNGPEDGKVPIFLASPGFPVCVVDPPQADPGDTVLIEASGLLPNEQAHVVLGDAMVATGAIDGQGVAKIELILPGDTRPGPRLVTVGVDGTALTADCTLEIRGEIGREPETGGRAERAASPLVGAWALGDGGAGPASVAVFSADGTFLSLNGNPGAGSAAGEWRATGVRAAEVTALALSPGALGAASGSAVVVRATVQASADGQRLEGTYTVEVAGREGAPSPGRLGPIRIVGRRIAAEPLGAPGAAGMGEAAGTPAP